MTAASTFLLAMGSAIVGTLLARSAAERWEIMSHPNPIVRQHTRPVAYLGGVGVFLGCFVAIGCVWMGSPAATVSLEIRQFAVSAFLFMALGICDDLKAFPAASKFLLQLVIALIAVFLGNRFMIFGRAFPDVFLSTLWILALVNAFNFIDVCDGLAAGVAVIALAALCLGNAAHSIYPLAACGATLGFLVFNIPPASVFLGDAGSHLLGFLTASFSMTVVGKGHPWLYGVEVILISGVPLFELVFITSIRLGKHLPWWRGSPDHFSLRLQAAGLTRFQTDLCGWTLAALMAAAGLSLEHLSPAAGAFCITIVLLTLVACARLLLLWDPRKC